MFSFKRKGKKDLKMSKKNILDYVLKDTKEQFKELLEVDFDIEKLTGSKLMKVNQVNYDKLKVVAKEKNVSALDLSGHCFDLGLNMYLLRDKYIENGELDKFELLISSLLYNLEENDK